MLTTSATSSAVKLGLSWVRSDFHSVSMPSRSSARDSSCSRSWAAASYFWDWMAVSLSFLTDSRGFHGIFEVDGHGRVADTNSGGSLVYNVYAFVWKEAVCNISGGEVCSLLDRVVGDIQVVVVLVAGLQASEDIYGLLNGGFLYLDGLEAAFQGRGPFPPAFGSRPG